MKTAKRITSLLLAVALAFSLAASCFAGDTALTRQEAAEMLVQAADDYHCGVKTEDILKGYPDGNLDLRGTLTRAQALVMLDRAFGGLPAPVGDHARTAAGMQGFPTRPCGAARSFRACFLPVSSQAKRTDCCTPMRL